MARISPEGRLQLLYDLALVWRGNLEKILNDKHDRSLYVFTTKKQERERMLLLSLRTWSLKYKLTPEEILDVLVPFWSKFERKYKNNKGRKGLGVGVSTFCSDRSEEVLKKYIAENHPNQENIQAWRAREQEKCLRRDKIKGQPVFLKTSLRDYVASYQKRISKTRKGGSIKMDRGDFIKRRWPGSPWV